MICKFRVPIMWRGSVLYSLLVVLESCHHSQTLIHHKYSQRTATPHDFKVNNAFTRFWVHLLLKLVKSYNLFKLSQWTNMDSSKLKMALVVPFVFSCCLWGQWLSTQEMVGMASLKSLWYHWWGELVGRYGHFHRVVHLLLLTFAKKVVGKCLEFSSWVGAVHALK